MTGTKRKWGFCDPTIGERILEARIRTGLSQRQAVKRTPYTAAYLSRIENGQRTPSVPFLRSISPILGVSPVWLETGQAMVDVRITVTQAARLLEKVEADSSEWELVQTLMAALGVEREYVRGLA